MVVSLLTEAVHLSRFDYKTFKVLRSFKCSLLTPCTKNKTALKAVLFFVRGSDVRRTSREGLEDL